VNPTQGRPRSASANARRRATHDEQLALDHAEPLADNDQVGVVGHIARRRPEVDDGPRLGALILQRVDVRHHVVTQAALPLGGFRQIHVVEVDLEPAICASVIGSPAAFCASASAVQMRRHVRARLMSDQSSDIARLAYRVDRWLS
jgi:hypothetical protein